MEKPNSVKGNTDHDGSIDENDGLKKGLKSIKSFFGGNSKKAENDDSSTSTENPISALAYLNVKSTPTSADNAQPSGSFSMPSCYNMINEVPTRSRGHLVIIVNKTFHLANERTGAELDLVNMKAIAKEMGFDVSGVSTLPQNMKKQEIEILLEKTRKADHSKCDSFLVMISSHGGMYETTYMSGGKEHGITCSDDQPMYTRHILEKFNDVNCPTLKDKPKIFIIQACRGHGLDDGADVNLVENVSKSKPPGNDGNDSKDNTDAKNIEKTTDVPDVRAKQDTGPPPQPLPPPTMPSVTQAPAKVISSKNGITCYNDMLVLYAIPPGKMAWRSQPNIANPWSKYDGSWLIHYLHMVITDPNRRGPDNFLKILSKVAAQMSNRTTNTDHPAWHDKKAVSLLEHNLSRLLII